MKFKLPEDLTKVEDISATLAAALADYKELAAISDEDITDEQIADLEALSGFVTEIQAEATARETAAVERSERIAAARANLDAATAEPKTDEPDEEDPEEEGDLPELPADVVVPDDASEINQEESVTASGSTTARPVARRAAARAPKVETPVSPSAGRASMVASADVPGFGTGAEITDMAQLTAAFQARLKGFPSQRVEGAASQRYGVANIKKVVQPEFSLERGQNELNYEKIVAASKEARLPGGSLVAAGGWCAPSETVYNMLTLETVSGILSMPEVTIAHGGINFTKGPDFSAIYTASGFLQTEAQAVAGATKSLMDVQCPPFTEVRMDAIGYGVRAGLLTNSAWPELVRRYIEGAIVAHAHKVNVSKIARIVTLLGASLNATEFGAASGDVLAALALRAVALRYKFRLDPAAQLEGFAPVWLKEVIRSDMAYHADKDSKAISDAEIDGWLKVRGIALQWVYDWQDITQGTLVYPATVDVALYPAGTFVAGTTDVISLDAVYDTASLVVNTFTAAFFEEGIMVFNPSGSGVLTSIALDTHGRVGRYDITSLTTGYPA